VLAVSPSGSLFASGGNDKRVVLWGFNGKRILTLDHNETVTALAFNADGSILVTGTSNGVIKLWNLNTRVNKQITRLPAVINAIALTPDTQTLAIGDQSGNIKLWNLSNNQGGIVLKPGGSIKTLNFSDANTLVSGGDRITVWNWKTGQVEKTFVGHSQPVQSMVIRGNFLISASLDGTIKIWDFKSK
ncbi:MAG: WD40 repeat domain-containing protein, partial [Microcoleaceae cyanobacterium]